MGLIAPRKIESILPIDIANRISRHVLSTGFRYGHRSTQSMGYAHWSRDYGGGTVENGLDISESLSPLMTQAWSHLQKNVGAGMTLLRCYANAHTFGTEGYPHTDSERNGDLTVVIYLNQNWRREWGGETVIYNGDEIVHAELPKFNSGLCFAGNAFHVAKPVSRICPELRVTLMFKMAPFGLDPIRDGLQVYLTENGAHNAPHSRRNLRAHLLHTYDLLNSVGQRSEVCLAGGLHSVCGTNIYRNGIVADKQSVIDRFGKSGELAMLFAELDRPKVLEKYLSTGQSDLVLTGQCTEQDMRDLCAIEAANLEDQKVLNSNYPKLLALWNSLIE